MYTNPELSAQAKRLRSALRAAGLALSHTQAMEALAKVNGSRTLHVDQAKKCRQGVDVGELAIRQAADLVFEKLGSYEGNILGLIEAIKAAFVPEDAKGSRSVEAEIHRIFGQPDSPQVSVTFAEFKLQEVPEQFEITRQRLEKTLLKQFEPPAPSVDQPQLLYKGPALDWRLSDGFSMEELPAHHRTAFEARVERSGHQLFVDISVPHSSPEQVVGTDQLTLFIEINEGRPCVHITNDRYGDQVMSVYATKDGLLIRPASTDQWVRTGVAEEGTALRQLHDELTHERPALDRNICFIPNEVIG